MCEQHKNDPEPEKEEESKDGERKQKQIVKLEGWDEEFMSTINYINEQGQSILFDIIIAANLSPYSGTYRYNNDGSSKEDGKQDTSTNT